MAIILAEDGDDYARVLVALFNRNGIDVTRVPSGTEAYDLIKKGPPPELLMTDVMMPGMSGFELLARLKAEGIMPPTIVLTSKQREEDVIRGLGYGAIDYITKPFSPAVVLARVQRILAKKGNP